MQELFEAWAELDELTQDGIDEYDLLDRGCDIDFRWSDGNRWFYLNIKSEKEEKKEPIKKKTQKKNRKKYVKRKQKLQVRAVERVPYYAPLGIDRICNCSKCGQPWPVGHLRGPGGTCKACAGEEWPT